MTAPRPMSLEEAALRERYAEQLSPAWFTAGLAAREVVRDAAASSAPLAPPLPKAFATAQARLALAGFQLEVMADGSFVVAKWTMTRSLPDLAAVDEFVAQVGA